MDRWQLPQWLRIPQRNPKPQPREKSPQDPFFILVSENKTQEGTWTISTQEASLLASSVTCTIDVWHQDSRHTALEAVYLQGPHAVLHVCKVSPVPRRLSKQEDASWSQNCLFCWILNSVEAEFHTGRGERQRKQPAPFYCLKSQHSLTGNEKKALGMDK